MLHILLVILKILFFLLIFAVLFVLGVLFLVLCVPIHYQASASKENGLTEDSDSGSAAGIGKRILNEISAQIRIHWLLHFLHISFSLSGTKTRLAVRVLGYPVIGRKKKRASTKAGKADGKSKQMPEMEEDFWEEEIPEAAEEFLTEEIPKAAEEFLTEEIPEAAEEFLEEDVPEVSEEFLDVCAGDPQESEQQSAGKTSREKESEAEFSFVKRILAFVRANAEKIRGIVTKIRNSFRGLADKLKNIQNSWQKMRDSFESYQRLWYDEHTRNAWGHFKKEISYLLRHFWPRRLRGDVRFGLGDPAKTGEVLGVLYMIQAFLGNDFSFEADFEEVCLEGSVFIKGRIRLCHLLKIALALWFDRHVRITIKRFQKMQGRT